MKSANDVSNYEASEKSGVFGVRHVQALLMFICLTIGYGMRVTMSMAIVAMTDKVTTEEKGILVFNWSKQIQDLILSSFFWGYTCMQIPGGHIAHKYGAKHLLVFALIINGLVSLVLPEAARLAGWKAVCACRVVQGLAQGSFIPSLHTLQGKWAPLEERGKISSYIYGGSPFGTILAMSLSGFLAASSYGWPSIFYSSGVVSIIWGLIWFWFGAESPAKHKTISECERNYIQSSLGQNNMKKNLKVPWKQILTSMPVLSVVVAHTGSSWLHVTLFTEIPSYLNKVMGINLKANGLLSALPFLGMWLSGFLFSFLSDYFINKKVCSLTVARKVANTIGKWGSAVGFLALAFIPANQPTLAVITLVIAASLKAATYVGYHVNHIDISPNFAGTLISITNAVSNLCGLMAPITAGLVLKNEYDPVEWRIVFCILSVIVFLANLFYIIFGSAEKADWNEAEYFEVELKTVSTMEKLIDNKKKNSVNST